MRERIGLMMAALLVATLAMVGCDMEISDLTLDSACSSDCLKLVGTDGGCPPCPCLDSGVEAATPDAVIPDSKTPDAAPIPDAAPTKPDAPAPDAGVKPDAAPAPDAASKADAPAPTPDSAPKPDAPVAKPDAPTTPPDATPTSDGSAPDAATPTPDAVIPTPDAALTPDALTPDATVLPDVGPVMPKGTCTYQVYSSGGKKYVKYCDAGGLTVNSFVFGCNVGMCMLAVPKGGTLVAVGNCIETEVSVTAMEPYNPTFAIGTGHDMAIPVYLVADPSTKGWKGTQWLTINGCAPSGSTKSVNHKGSYWISLK